MAERKQRISAPPIIDELRLDELMAKAGMKSLQELADRMGIERASLSRSLNGSPTYAMLYNMAEALGVKVYELFKSDENSAQRIQGVIAIDNETYIIDSVDDFKRVEEVVKSRF